MTYRICFVFIFTVVMLWAIPTTAQGETPTVTRWQEREKSGQWEEIQPPSEALFAGARAASSLDGRTGSLNFLTLMCALPDLPEMETSDTTYFAGMYPELNRFWNEASYGKLQIEGDAHGWMKLPKPSSEYLRGRLGWDQTGIQFAADCFQLARAEGIVLEQYAGVQFVVNGFAGHVAAGGFYCEPARCWQATWLPRDVWPSLAMVAHEMGHTLGLGHSAGVTGNAYTNPFDVMSDAYQCAQPHGTYNCLPQHTIAYHRDRLGWIDPSLRQEVAAKDGVQTITLDRISQPANAGQLMVTTQPLVWFHASFYTLELRERVGYDRALPAEGIVVHQVQPYRSDDAWLRTSLSGEITLGPGDVFYVPGEIEVCVLDRTSTGQYRVQVAVGPDNRCGSSSLTFLPLVLR